MEHQLHELISKEEDLINYPDKVYSLLSRSNLLPDNDENRQHEQPKFIAIFDYLLENAQIYAILKAIWKLNVENTSLISDHSLKTVLDWSWSKVTKIKIELNILRKTLGSHALTANWSQPPPLDSDQLDSFLSRASSLLEGLIQIYKQFIKLETTSREGHAQLNKRLCIIESMKFYVEHLVLFHKFEMLLAPPRPHTSPQKAAAAQDNVVVTHRNYLSEMHINFAIIEKRWITRRQQQDELLNAIATTGDNNGESADVIYPFTYLIDCLFEECRAFANVAQLFHPGKTNDERDNETFVGGYPPKSLIELLDICLECNIGTKMKQIIILYVLCDLMHTEFSSAGQKHILKLINAYCSNTFTIMSTQLDSVLSVPWSTSSTSIVSVGSDGADPNNSSCLFDLVNGFYLIDSRIADKAFKYLRATDLNYLEFYEKYFILYNTMSIKDHKTAAQYLWLFQKLNANSIVSATNDLTSGASVIENELGLFRFMAKSGTGNSVNELNKLKHEQKMHARLFLTIYLANQLVNEAYNLVKPHLKNVKSVLKTPSLSSHPGVKFSKELLIHFFLQVDRYNQWKHVNELTSQDKDLLLVMFNFLEASNKLSLICMAIDLHVNSQNYNKAIELYDRYAKQIVNSKYSYLATMVEIAREVHTEYTADDEDEFSALKYSLITSQDIKETQNFENKFTVSLRELCKNSKRCINLLSRPEDEVYINLLKMPLSIEASETSSTSSQQQQRQVKFCSSTTKLPSSESTNSLPSHTPYKLTLTPAEATRTPIRKSILANNDHHHLEDDYGDSPKRRKPSTPHPTRGVFKFTSEEEEEEAEDEDEDKDEAEDKGNDDIEEEMNEIKETPVVDTVTTTAAVTKETTPPPKRSPKLKPPMSENNRVLTSSLRITRVMGAASAAKSVKFSAVKHTRNFCGVNVNVDFQEKMDLDEETNVEEKPKRDVHKKLVFADDDANNGGAKTRASLKPVRKEELQLSPEVDEDDKKDDDYKPKSSLSLKKPTFTTTTTVMTRRSQICSSEEIRKSLNEIADHNPKRKSLPNSRRSMSEQPPKPEQQQAEEEEPITETTSVPPSPPRDSTAQSQSLAAKAVSPIMSFVASMGERIVASLSPRAATGVVENATETVTPVEQQKSPSTSKSPDNQVKDSPAATRKSFFSMLGFNLTPRSNEKQPKEAEVVVEEEKKPDNEIVLDTSEETSTSSSPPRSPTVSPSRSSIKITPKKKPTEETSSHPLMKCSTSVELAPHASEELTTARMSPIRPSTSRAEAMKLSDESSLHPLMKCSTSVQLAPHASEELTTARMSPIRPSTSRAEAMKLSEEPSIETASVDTPMDQDIVEIEDEEENTAKASEDDDLVSLDEDEEEEIETQDEPIVTATTTTTTIEIKYLTETELEERKTEEANNEDYQYDLLDSLNGRKNTIRFTQVDEVATQSHRVEQVEPVVESTEPVVEPTEQVVEVTTTTEPAVDLNETLERENNDDENEGEKQPEEEKQEEEPTEQTPTKTAINKEESFNMSSVSHDGDANVNQDEPTTKKSPVIQLSPTTAAQPNEEFAIPRMSRTNSESSLFSQISSVSEHYEKMKRQEAEQKAAAAAVEEEDDEKRNEKGSKLKRGRQVSLRSSTRPTISTRAAATTTRSHHMDDDELKKTSEEVLSSRKTSAKGSIVRRRSDLSSASSAASAASSRNHQAVAKLAENIPESFGTSENEVRLTRSKLKNLLVQEEDGETEEEKSTVGEDEEKSASAAPPTTTTTRLTRRNSRRQQQPAQPQPHLEQVNENEELSTTATATATTTRMSAYNLKKHNAAMDKLSDESHEDAAKRAKKPPVSTGRVTRSAKTTRSPSPTASSVISASSVVSSVTRSAISVASTSTTASQQTKRRGRPPRAPISTPTLSVGDNEQDKTLKADEDENEENESHNSPDICLELSPNGSQVSTAMSEATGRQRMTRRRAAVNTSSTTAQPVKRSATPPNSSSSTQRAALVSRSYSLRSKAPPTKNRDDDSVASELCPLDEVIKPQQVAKKSTRGTRARKSLNTESESLVDDASSVVSEQTNEPDEIETLVKRTRSRAKKSPVKEDEEHEVKSKLTRTESEEEKFKFSNPRNVTYGTSKSSKKGSAASAKFEFSPPSPIKK